MSLLELSDLNTVSWDVVIRADVNEDIGSGHAVRCMAIADSIERQGGSTLFVVSSADSASVLLEAGRDCVALSGDWMSFDASDGSALGLLCHDVQAASLMVDSYAVTDEFFAALDGAKGEGCRVAWIDDRYTYELEEQERPIVRDVDCVVNYSLGMSLAEYESSYVGTRTKLCIGPLFAPLRSQFSQNAIRTYGPVERIMVTTGSTNERWLLERMTRACLRAVPDAQVDVVVGSMATFAPFDDDRVVERRGISDLAPLMRESDLCISAAGTTLYELSSIGVPSIVIPIVENQLPNAAGFERLGLGLVVADDEEMERGLVDALGRMASSPEQREAFVSKMHAAVDGAGAERIAFELMRQ